MPKVFVAGHGGMVGSAIIRALERCGDCELIVRTRAELDLTSQRQVQDFFDCTEIDQVYLAAAKVGGIHANNSYPADFLYDNLMIQSNVVRSAFDIGVKKLLFFGSSCIYPKKAIQPIKEEYLLDGPLEPTNEPYALAKIAGLKLCQAYNRQYGKSMKIDYRCIMPTNLYGPYDNYHPTDSHVVPGLIKRFHEAKISGAKSVVVWGTGNPLREFMHVDDLASAAVHLMNVDASLLKSNNAREFELNWWNAGSSNEISIRELAETIAEIVGFRGVIQFDSSRPDGTKRKLLDSSRLRHLGWEPTIGLKDGLISSYKNYLEDGLGRD